MVGKSEMEGLLRDPSELGKEGCAIALRKALFESARFRTIREVSDAAKVNYNTTKDYFQGRHLANRKNWKKITSVFLAEMGEGMPARKRKATSAADKRRLPTARAARVLKTLEQLGTQLEFFKTGSQKGRDLLRRVVPATDVGYVTSLLRALYDEDQLEEWILFSNYRMKGAGPAASRDK